VEARRDRNAPPVFIVVCNNTSTSKLVQEWISSWERPNEDGEPVFEHNGHLELFRNYDANGNPLHQPNTLLIDSQQPTPPTRSFGISPKASCKSS
jgi:type III restriction enzyme